MDRQIIDKDNMGSAIYHFPDHISEVMEICKPFTPKTVFPDIHNIVVAGMGGSAIGGDVCRVLLSQELTIPFVVCRNYSLPNWVNEHTLVICSSYSGNTEETLSAFENAKEKGAHICGISTGGILTGKLKEGDYDIISIPAGLQPRAALAFSFIPMIFLLLGQRLINNKILDDIHNAIDLLRQNRDLYNSEEGNNPALSIAKQIYKTIPIIYGTSDSTVIAAIRWKGQFSENADMLAYHNELPEMNHNEIMGWENNADLLDNLSVFWLTDKNDHARINLRQKITKKIIEMRNKNQHIITVEGLTPNSRLLHLIHFGDWISYWCAILHGTDPTPVESIMQLKSELSSKT